MRFVVLDLETYFADDFTLSKMSTESYIRDPRFKAHGAAIKWSKDHAAKWYDEAQLRYVLSQEDWSDVCLIHHHANFDGLILSHHYGVRPHMYGCTLSMARLLLGNHISVSLDSVRSQYGMAEKKTPYNLFRGKRWEELDQTTRQTLAEGCEDEVESIWKIFGILAKNFPAEEYEVVDSIIRMFVNPVLQADTDLLAALWESEARAKDARMHSLGIVEADVQSAARFQALLEAEGVEIGYKENPKKELIPAFAKNDDFMLELLEHDNDRIRTLAEARIGAKSTLLQTRAETLAWSFSRGPMPVYLRYCGAVTLRPTGGDGCLTGDTEILVWSEKGLTIKPMVDIKLTDLIWDGEAFVEHDGVVCRGFREVINHDGITGTPDHIVYAISGKEISLAAAASSRTQLMDCREPYSGAVASVGEKRKKQKRSPRFMRMSLRRPADGVISRIEIWKNFFMSLLRR